MKTISIANQKGGAGKTTLLVVLATALAVNYGYRVLVIDGDPQQSITKLRASDEPALAGEREFLSDPTLDFPYPVVSQELAAIPDYLAQVEEAFDITFIDLPGRADSSLLNDVLASSEVVLVPMQATFLDQQATLDFLAILHVLAEYCKKENLEFQPFGVTSRKTASREEKEMNEFADAAGLARFASTLGNRVAYTRLSSLFSFLDLDYLKRIDAKPSIEQEVRAMCDELVAKANLSPATVPATV
ncbi:ParA family protein (plasmid) [Hymenobacter sp. BRD128]|uniref:ParA family protein n=1 Tax=Hymenobacter sp. BRD128 TaxID=2675878 RepID=UPI001563CAC6|nr:ParA family protein [Hymenobacter sp. BRD128]QKG59112.1 ParA family protein [Hymenobacter sp. BRD128]